MLKLSIMNQASIRYRGEKKVTYLQRKLSKVILQVGEDTGGPCGTYSGKQWQSSENFFLPESSAARWPTNHDLYLRHRLVSFALQTIRVTVEMFRSCCLNGVESGCLTRALPSGRMHAEWSQNTDICFSMLLSNSKKQFCDINPALKIAKPFVFVIPPPPNWEFSEKNTITLSIL